LKDFNGTADLETLWVGIGDSLYGFASTHPQIFVTIMESSSWMRRFDFDAEAVGHAFAGRAASINIPAPVKC
jgi:hypothetical protein